VKFLGQCSYSYYRRFGKGFATVVAPLHLLTKKGHKFEWTVETQDSFEKLKKALITSPVLAY